MGEELSPEKKEVTPEMLAKARRAKIILYGVMILFVFLPFLIWWLTS